MTVTQWGFKNHPFLIPITGLVETHKILTQYLCVFFFYLKQYKKGKKKYQRSVNPLYFTLKKTIMIVVCSE